MSVIGTPIVGEPGGVVGSAVVAAPPSTSPEVCATLNQVSAEVTHYYRKLLLKRMRSIKVRQTQAAVINWNLVDHNGNYVNLAQCGLNVGEVSESLSESSDALVGEGIRFRMRESLRLGFSGNPPAYTAEVVDTDNGLIRIELDPAATARPGVFFAEIGVFTNINTDEEVLLHSNVFYLIVDPGLGGEACSGGPPSIAEVRLRMRDSDFEENLLLDNLAFDDAEIAFAIGRPVQYWNEIPPDIRRYSISTFPFRYHWLEAICGELCLIAAERYRRNNLQYSAAGVAIDDQNKEPSYEAAAQRLLTGWKDFVRRKKSEMNLAACFGEVRSSYDQYRR